MTRSLPNAIALTVHHIKHELSQLVHTSQKHSFHNSQKGRQKQHISIFPKYESAQNKKKATVTSFLLKSDFRIRSGIRNFPSSKENGIRERERDDRKYLSCCIFLSLGIVTQSCVLLLLFVLLQEEEEFLEGVPDFAPLRANSQRNASGRFVPKRFISRGEERMFRKCRLLWNWRESSKGNSVERESQKWQECVVHLLLVYKRCEC